jgi:hypothetical protein
VREGEKIEMEQRIGQGSDDRGIGQWDARSSTARTVLVGNKGDPSGCNSAPRQTAMAFTRTIAGTMLFRNDGACEHTMADRVDERTVKR